MNAAAAHPHSPRLRILVVSEPGFAGVKRHVVEVLSHIDTERFEVCLVYSLVRADGLYRRDIEHLRARGIRCLEVPMGRGIRPWRDLAAMLQIRRIIAEFRPAIVHGHSSKAGFLARVAACLVFPRPRTLYCPHAMSFVYAKQYWFLEMFAGCLTDCLVAVSRSEAADFRRWRIPARRIATIPLSISADTHYPPRVAKSGGPTLIATCGRISRQKNGLLFFKTAVEVMARRPDVLFRWIGSFDSDDETEEVRRFIASEPLARKVEITGWVDDANALIAEADIFCMLSRYESFGYAVADAMMLSLPVVATRVTGLVDLIAEGETGFLCEPEVSKVAPVLIRLIENRQLREQMGRNGRERLEKVFSSDNTVRLTEELYSSMGGRSAAPSSL